MRVLLPFQPHTLTTSPGKSLRHGCRAHRLHHQTPDAWVVTEQDVCLHIRLERPCLLTGTALCCSQSKNADDIVITLAIRTPLTKAKKGGFKDTSLEYMVYALLNEVKNRSGLDPALVEDIALGNASRTLSF